MTRVRAIATSQRMHLASMNALLTLAACALFVISRAPC